MQTTNYENENCRVIYRSYFQIRAGQSKVGHLKPNKKVPANAVASSITQQQKCKQMKMFYILTFT